MFLVHPEKIILIVVPGTGSSSVRRGFIEKHPTKHHKSDVVRRPELVERLGGIGNHPEIKAKMPLVKMDAHGTAEQTKMILEKENRGEIWEEYKKIGFIRHPVSWVRSMYQKDTPGTRHWFSHDPKCTPNAWVERLEFNPYKWLAESNGKGQPLVDEIWKLEELENFCTVYKIGLHHKQKSAHKPFVLSDRHLEIIHKKFHREYRHYSIDDDHLYLDKEHDS